MKYETDYYRNLFKEGKTLSEIVDITGDGYPEIHKIIKDLKGGRFTHNDVSQKHKDDMAQMYRDGVSSVAIGKKYGVDHKFIGRILDTYGIKRIGNGQRTYKVNEHYFDEIDTPEKAYILGFLDAEMVLIICLNRLYLCLYRKVIVLSLKELIRKLAMNIL